MKLLELHIENFGTLHDYSLDLSSNLVCLQRENGFGKTTLASFIKAMFYGMAKKGNNKAFNVDRSRYKPWQGGVYGGQLTFESELGKFRIVRTFGDTPEGDAYELVDLSTGLKSDKYSKNTGFDLFGVGIETFEITAFFPQLELTAGINDEVRASLVGANKFENDLAGFTDAQKAISERIRQLKKLQVSKADMERLENIYEQLRNRLNAIAQQQKTLSVELEEWEEELAEVRSQLKSLAALQEKVKKYNSEKSKLEGEIFELQNKITELFTINLQQEPKEPQKKQQKPKSKLPAILLTAGVAILFVVFVCLGAFKVLSFVVAAICMIAVALLGVLGFVLLSRKEAAAFRERVENTLPEENPAASQSLTLLNEQLSIKKTELKLSYSQEKTFDEDKFSELQAQKFELEKKLSVEQANNKILARDAENIIEQLEQFESQLELKRAEDLKAREGIAILEKTLAFMKQAQENVSVRFMTPMQSGFEKYFNKISNKEVKLDINFDANLQTGLGGREFEYLSQGYRDIVSVCKRLTLIENVYKGEKPFIIMDDPFVNLDNTNFEVMKEILHEISKTYQIIYLNCHDKTSL